MRLILTLCLAHQNKRETGSPHIPWSKKGGGAWAGLFLQAPAGQSSPSIMPMPGGASYTIGHLFYKWKDAQHLSYCSVSLYWLLKFLLLLPLLSINVIH